MLVMIVFRAQPSLGKVSHYYYHGNRCPIKMSCLPVVLFNKQMPEIHQEKGIIGTVLYFDISLSKTIFNSKDHFIEIFNLGCISYQLYHINL